MSQSTVRKFANRLALPRDYLAEVIDQHQISPLDVRTPYEWEKLEQLLKTPPNLAYKGWTYYAPFDTLARFHGVKGQKAWIQPPGLALQKVALEDCHHPYTTGAGGGWRWKI